MKVDFVSVKDNILVHKQIEKRDGRIYMRIRKRPVIIVGHA